MKPIAYDLLNMNIFQIINFLWNRLFEQILAREKMYFEFKFFVIFSCDMADIVSRKRKSCWFPDLSRLFLIATYNGNIPMHWSSLYYVYSYEIKQCSVSVM